MLLKKGAMLGLASIQRRQGFSQSRAFKKQFGELFLARMKSVTPKEAHEVRIQTKRGAMFGLDARIALAIFGALSVISGAALYSAIENSKATAVVTELNEIAKAWEAYYLDTGSPIPAATGIRSNIHKLVEDTTSTGWKGPYLPYPIRTSSMSDYSLLHPVYDHVYIMMMNDKSDWGIGTAYTAGVCAAGDNCYAWAYLSGMQNTNLQEAVDQIVDGGDGSETGRVKWTTGKTNIIFRIAKIDNPND